jgi:hypothetical protein
VSIDREALLARIVSLKKLVRCLGRSKANDYGFASDLKNARTHLRKSHDLAHTKYCFEFRGEYFYVDPENSDVLRSVRQYVAACRANIIRERRDRRSKQIYRYKTSRGFELAAFLERSGSRFVHTYKGQFLAAQEAKRAAAIFNSKRPTNRSEYVGVEIECISRATRRELGEQLCFAGLHKYVQLKDDGSIRAQGDYNYTHEIAVCVPLSEFEGVIKRTCEIVRRSSAVNTSCGLHVHVDMRELVSAEKLHRIFSNFVSCNGVFSRLIPKSRRENKFCKRNRTKNFDASRRSSSRYWFVNALSWSAHRTLEIRCHSGTIDSDKIINWVKFLLAIKRHDGELKQVRSIKKLASTLALPFELTRYLQEREKKFADETQTESLEA